MRKNKEIKFIQIDDQLVNVNNIQRIYKADDGRTCISFVRSYAHSNESFESIKKKLESITLKE